MVCTPLCVCVSGARSCNANEYMRWFALHCAYVCQVLDKDIQWQNVALAFDRREEIAKSLEADLAIARYCQHGALFFIFSLILNLQC